MKRQAPQTRINVWLGLHRCLAGIFLSMAMVSTCFGAPSVRATVKAAVVVDTDSVFMSDVATLTGGSGMNVTDLEKIVVATSPRAGQTRFLGVDYIRIRLKNAGIDPDIIEFRGATDIRITRRAVVLPIGQLRREVERTIRSRMPWKDENVIITNISFDDTVDLPAGRLSYRVETNGKEDFLGRTLLALHLYVDGKPVRKLWVNATICVETDVVTVVRPLGKHQHVELADLSVERRDLAKLPKDTIRSMEEALGHRTTRMIYPNTILQSSMIVTPPLVKRGDIVKIVASSGPMTITATGMVKNQGRRGDLVRVVNMDSNRMVTARVTGSNAVLVEF